MAGNRPTDDEQALDQEDLEFGSPATSASDIDDTDADHAMLRVRVSLKGRPIRSYTFNKDVIEIGRDPDSDVYLDNPGISRNHLRLEKSVHGYYAEDLGSANGSYLNDDPLQKELIKSDDVLRIGKFSLWISYEEDRRGSDGQDRSVPAAMQQGTTVLSTTELQLMMAKAREAGDKPVQQPVRKAQGSLGVSRQVFTTWIIVTTLLGAAAGAGAFWFLTR